MGIRQDQAVKERERAAPDAKYFACCMQRVVIMRTKMLKNSSFGSTVAFRLSAKCLLLFRSRGLKPRCFSASCRPSNWPSLGAGWRRKKAAVGKCS